jgi:DNA polymerase-3 subunit delta'
MGRLLLCQSPTAAGGCGSCRSCELALSGAHPDWFRLQLREDKSQIIVEDARDMIAFLGLTTTVSKRKLALVTYAEQMNRSSANSLLKTLEEPPGDAVLILVSHDPARLPVTIRSRCQAIVIGMPAAPGVAEWLCKRHGLDLPEAEQALAASGGSPLRAAEFHDAGLVSSYQEVCRRLATLGGNPGDVGALAAAWQDIAADVLWLWLSSLAAEATRADWAQRRTGWVADARLPDRRHLLRLQQRADRNRQLVKTAVRGDLLLRDWLIEWCDAAYAQR